MGWGPLRRIVVDGRLFRWRFNDVLVVIPGDRSGPQLYVDWGWRDWLEPDGPGAEPHVVTPQFVAKAVRHAAAMGWPSATGGPPLRLGFRGDRFTVAVPDGEPSTAADGGGK
ncbi:MAG: hypothetical protein K2W96_09820 [Gemmataceae bacterium]|nr:hypothetical protein [Gemmataceae bacterium]